jgi:hypothetical protein
MQEARNSTMHSLPNPTRAPSASRPGFST